MISQDGFIQVEDDQSLEFTSFHHLIGFIVFFAAVLMIIMGLTMVKMTMNDKIHQMVLIPSRRIHGYIGKLIYILSRLNLLTGAVLGGGAWMGIVYPYIFLSIAFQIIMSMRSTKFNAMTASFTYKPQFNLTDKQKAVISKINQGETREKIIEEHPDVKWFFFGNFIIDLSNWIHPGGNYILSAIVGREVTPFLNGAYTLEDCYELISPHMHTRFAFELIQNSIIGSIKNYDSVLMKKGIQDGESHFGTRWVLKNRTRVTNNVSRFDFSSDQFFSKQFVGGHLGLGRHFAIRFLNKPGPTRTYTTAMAMIESNGKMRDILFNALENDQKIELPKDIVSPISYLPLYIKRYNFINGLSKKLHEVDLNNPSDCEFILEGPFGRGLGLSPNSSGKYTIISSGTGIFLFADFMQYLFIKAIYDIMLSKKKNTEANKILELGFDFPTSFKKISVKLIAAFDGLDEFYCEDLIRRLAFISHKYKLGMFEAVISDGNPSEGVSIDKKRFESGFLAKQVDMNSEAFWICGPPQFNKTVPAELIAAGAAKSRIIFV